MGGKTMARQKHELLNHLDRDTVALQQRFQSAIQDHYPVTKDKQTNIVLQALVHQALSEIDSCADPDEAFKFFLNYFLRNVRFLKHADTISLT
jgi:regulator of sirC expression with transglutaminase-like and TPR domain